MSVRTLHHYEQLGLLIPDRTPGNQRRYRAGDVRRLYRIRALRELGLTLSEIGRVLEEGPQPLGAMLEAQLDDVERQLERLGARREVLRHVVGATGLTSAEQLEVVEAVSLVVRRPRLARPEVSWQELGRSLRACMDGGEPPGSSRTRAAVAPIARRIERFAGGDAATLHALARIRRLAPPSELAGWTPELVRYLDRALAALEPPPASGSTVDRPRR